MKTEKKALLILGIILLIIGIVLFIARDSLLEAYDTQLYSYVLGPSSFNKPVLLGHIANIANKYSPAIMIGGIVLIVIHFLLSIANSIGSKNKYPSNESSQSHDDTSNK